MAPSAETSTMHTARKPISIATFAALVAFADCAQAQTTAGYCAELKHVIALATTEDRFASITGSSREGNFSDTTLALTGWQACALYGPAMYSCASAGARTLLDAAQAQVVLRGRRLICL